MAITKLDGALIKPGTNVGQLNTLTVSSSVGIGTLVPTGSLHVVGTTTLQQVLEKVSVSNTPVPVNLSFRVLSQGVRYYTVNNTAVWTINFVGSTTVSLNDVMYIGQSISVVVMATNGTTAYYPYIHQIDGVTITPKWQSGITMNQGNANGIDVYAYTIIKTANATFTVLASQTKFA